MTGQKTVTRFAPTPTGYLHLGHAYSAWFAAETARREEGTFLLRIEDIDATRCRPEFETAIAEDLRWLGLDWPEPVRRQSEHFADYRAALDRLTEMGLIYPCFLSRKELKEALEAPHLEPRLDPDGPVVFDSDGMMDEAERRRRMNADEPYALRLRVRRAMEIAGPLVWFDRDQGRQEARPEMFGDVVLARKDVPTSYHLAVTLDDALQEVSLVTRGEDLFQATHVHRLLQALLDLPVPEYRHHGLLADAEGKRLAKRRQSQSIRDLRAAGLTPEAVMAMARGNIA